MQADGLSLKLQASPTLTPSVLNTQLGDIPAYATNDLLVPHPTDNRLWRIYGRADDQIMHSNGEKVRSVLC